MRLLYEIAVTLAMAALVAATVCGIASAEVSRRLRALPWKKRIAALAALAIVVAYGGTKPGSGLRSSPRPATASRTAFTDAQLAAGFALAEARTDETHDFMPPLGAVIHEPWRKRGAHEDFISLPATNWSFPWGTATVSRATVLSSGEICLHAGDKAVYSPWIRPGMLRDELVLNALEDNGDTWKLPVPDTGVRHLGTATLPPDKTRFAAVTRVATAHRCDATRAHPYCSVCGCANVFNLSLDVQSQLTLKHHNQTAVRIVHENPFDSPHLGALVMIRRKGEQVWDTLGYEVDLDPWTARVAGTFELKGVAAIDGGLYETSIAEVEVRFPEYTEIRDDTNVVAFTSAAWAATLADCIETNRKERGFWILLNTSNDTYVAGKTKFGDGCRPDEQADIDLGSRPPDDPTLPSATDPGAIYPVASFHCHTPTTYRTGVANFFGRAVGPSGPDMGLDTWCQVPGLVYDYLSPPPGSGSIPPGHPKDAPATIYISLGYDRRPTP